MADKSIKYISFEGEKYEIDPCNHESETTDFGVSTSTLYGHCKIIEDFANEGMDAEGRALSAHAGYVLDRMEYSVVGTHTYNGYSYFTIPYPLPEKASSTIVAGGWYKVSGGSSWINLLADFDFYYNEDGILISPANGITSYDYKIVILVK